MPWDVVELPLKLVHQVVTHRDPPGMNYLGKTMPSGRVTCSLWSQAEQREPQKPSSLCSGCCITGTQMGLNNSHLFPHSSGGWKLRVKVLAE